MSKVCGWSPAEWYGEGANVYNVYLERCKCLFSEKNLQIYRMNRDVISGVWSMFVNANVYYMVISTAWSLWSVLMSTAWPAWLDVCVWRCGECRTGRGSKQREHVLRSAQHKPNSR